MIGLTTHCFSDKEFLNEDWHKYTCIESCAAIGNASCCECNVMFQHVSKCNVSKCNVSADESESLRTDIQSIREIDDSGSTLLYEIGNMMTNITGSSILEEYWQY